MAKKQKIELRSIRIQLSEDVLEHYNELADMCGAERKPYIEKMLTRYSEKLRGIIKTSLTNGK